MMRPFAFLRFQQVEQVFLTLILTETNQNSEEEGGLICCSRKKPFEQIGDTLTI